MLSVWAAPIVIFHVAKQLKSPWLLIALAPALGLGFGLMGTIITVVADATLLPDHLYLAAAIATFAGGEPGPDGALSGSSVVNMVCGMALSTITAAVGYRKGRKARNAPPLSVRPVPSLGVLEVLSKFEEERQRKQPINKHV
jgi:hypothetical protein